MIDRDSQRWLDLASSTHTQLTRAQWTQADLISERRHAIRMAVVNGATHQEIARVLGITRARVTVLVNHPESPNDPSWDETEAEA